MTEDELFKEWAGLSCLGGEEHEGSEFWRIDCFQCIRELVGGYAANARAARATIARVRGVQRGWMDVVDYLNGKDGMTEHDSEKIETLLECIRRLERALAGTPGDAPAKRCEVCLGRGELRDAVQAWDVPGAPVPECPHCNGTGRAPAAPGDGEEGGP